MNIFDQRALSINAPIMIFYSFRPGYVMEMTIVWTNQTRLRTAPSPLAGNLDFIENYKVENGDYYRLINVKLANRHVK